MKSKIQLLFMVFALAALPLGVTASVVETNTYQDFIKKVTLQHNIQCEQSSYLYEFTCEHYLMCGESMAFYDYQEGSCSYVYSAASIILIPCSTISSTTVATSPSNRQRTRIGVGEAVTVTISPTPSSTTWSISSGGGSLSSPSAGQVTYWAPATAGSATVRASVNGMIYSRTFEIVAPSGLYMERNEGLGIYHKQGLPSVGMKTDVYVLPNDVNFSAVEIREESCQGVGKDYFLPLNGITHLQTPTWGPLSGGHIESKGTKTAFPDQVWIKGEASWTLAAGTFVWQIPCSYKLQYDSGNGYPIGTGGYTATHAATAYASGTVNISKASSICTADLNDQDGQWVP